MRERCDERELPDCFNTEQRSAVMRAVRQRDTDVEMALRRVLWRSGMRYRVHRRIGQTRPDVCFVGRRVAVYVDGCFWHGCPDHYTAPRGNADFWKRKLRVNRDRDRRNTVALRSEGWTVLRFWACEVKSDVEGVAAKIKTTVDCD